MADEFSSVRVRSETVIRDMLEANYKAASEALDAAIFMRSAQRKYWRHQTPNNLLDVFVAEADFDAAVEDLPPRHPATTIGE